MKTLQITINENDMAGVEEVCIDIGKYCTEVAALLPEYDIEWDIRRNTSGVCPPPTVDFEEPSTEEYREIRNAQERAFQNPANW